MRVADIIRFFEARVSTFLQEDYDNSGLISGDPVMEVNGALICIDVTEEVIREAIREGMNLVVSHHPPIFAGLKKITGKSYTERIIVQAIKNDIALFCMHTNLDNQISGVNHYLAKAIGLSQCHILSPKKGLLRKMVTFSPVAHADMVREALFNAGAGRIGQYDSCSFNVEGQGTFRAGEHAHPFVGEIGKIHHEKEVRIETIFPVYLELQIIDALLNAHPYEEVAYDIYPLENTFQSVGAGMTGELIQSMSETDFLEYLKECLGLQMIRHSPLTGKPVRKIAVCGGSGSFLIRDALSSGADAFVTGDIKYHQFFDADQKILLADIGHYESERFTKELIFDLLKKNFPNFAVRISKIDTNPVRYYS